MQLQRRHAASLAILALISTVPAAGQATSRQWALGERQGPLSVAPLGMLSRTSGKTELLIRRAGPVAKAPEQWSTERFGSATLGHPDFSAAFVLAGLNRATPTPLMASELELGAISTGGDIIPQVLQGMPQLGRIDLQQATSWFFLSVTVAPKTTPHGLSGSTLRSLQTTESDIINYYSEESGGLEEELIDSTIVEQVARQVGFPSGAQDLVGLDWNMGLISEDPTGAQALALAPVRDKLYFTVSREWATKNPGHVIVATGAPFALAPDCIYSMTWESQGVSGLGWSAPALEFADSALFSDPGTSRAIDGLSVHALPGESRRVVLSTDLASGDPDQLLIYEEGVLASAVPLRTPLGNLFSEELGLNGVFSTDPDEVNGTCGRDPESPSFNVALAMPVPQPVEPGGEPKNNEKDPVDVEPGEDPVVTVGLSAVVSPLAKTLYLQATGAEPEVAVLAAFSVGLPANGIFIDELITPPQWFELGYVAVDPEHGTADLNLSLGGVPALGDTCLRVAFLDAKGIQLARSSLSVLIL